MKRSLNELILKCPHYHNTGDHVTSDICGQRGLVLPVRKCARYDCLATSREYKVNQPERNCQTCEYILEKLGLT